MGSLGQQTPVTDERDSSRMIIVIAVGVVIAVMVAVAFLLRAPAKVAKPASPYIGVVKLSDFKMSAAENFIGATVSNMLAPLRRLPLRVARFDFSPLVGVILIFALLHLLPKFILGEMAKHNLSPWPP